MLLVIPISLCVAMNQALAALPCHRRILLSGTPMQVSAKFHCSLMSIALKDSVVDSKIFICCRMTWRSSLPWLTLLILECWGMQHIFVVTMK